MLLEVGSYETRYGWSPECLEVIHILNFLLIQPVFVKLYSGNISYNLFIILTLHSWFFPFHLSEAAAPPELCPYVPCFMLRRTWGGFEADGEESLVRTWWDHPSPASRFLCVWVDRGICRPLEQHWAPLVFTLPHKKRERWTCYIMFSIRKFISGKFADHHFSSFKSTSHCIQRLKSCNVIFLLKVLDHLLLICWFLAPPVLTLRCSYCLWCTVTVTFLWTVGGKPWRGRRDIVV